MRYPVGLHAVCFAILHKAVLRMFHSVLFATILTIQNNIWPVVIKTVNIFSFCLIDKKYILLLLEISTK